MMDEFVGGGNEANPQSSLPDGKEAGDGSPLDQLLSTGTGLLSNVHKKSWQDAERTGVHFKALVLPKVGQSGAAVTTSQVVAQPFLLFVASPVCDGRSHVMRLSSSVTVVATISARE